MLTWTREASGLLALAVRATDGRRLAVGCSIATGSWVVRALEYGAQDVPPTVAELMVHPAAVEVASGERLRPAEATARGNAHAQAWTRGRA